MLSITILGILNMQIFLLSISGHLFMEYSISKNIGKAIYAQKHMFTTFVNHLKARGTRHINFRVNSARLIVHLASDIEKL